jgi:CHC2 zinc finger
METTAQAASSFLASLGISTNPAQKKSSFNRALLPSPESFWAEHGVNLQNRHGWVLVKCAFHEDSHPSMSVNAELGAFACHSCGAKGGDVLAAYRLLTGCDFMTAAKALNAWETK